MESTAPFIETRNLKTYFDISKTKKLHAVDDVSIQIARGETLGVVGESGCGKTTLGRSILRLVEPTAGQVLYEGRDVLPFKRKELRQLRQRLQIIFQDPYSSIDPRMTVSQIIGEYLQINGLVSGNKELEERTAELMNTVGLAPRLASAYPHELDGGRRQRIGIARALSMKPSFIVCDEPVSALDVSIQAQILNLLMDLQDDMGLTYMFITHDLSVVRHISHNILVMYLGQCVELASSETLFRNPLHPYTKALLAAIPEPDISMRSKKISVIRGEITSPVNPKPGCRFHARCPFASEKCVGRDIPLCEAEPRHQVACTLFDR